MQQGSIIHNSTFDEISISDPALFANWKQAIVEASESEISGSEHESDVMDEREALKREVRQKVVGGGGEVARGKQVSHLPLLRASTRISFLHKTLLR